MAARPIRGWPGTPDHRSGAGRRLRRDWTSRAKTDADWTSKVKTDADWTSKAAPNADWTS